MKKFFVILMLAVTAMTVAMSGAEAKRLGGGGSFGKQSSNYTRQVPSAPAQSPSNVAPAKPAAPAAAPQSVPPKPASPWKGILGGALLGLGLGALLSHFGLGGAMASMLSTILMVALLAFVAMFLFRMFTRKNGGNSGAAGNNGFTPQPAYASAPELAVHTPEIGSRIEPVGLQAPASLQGSNEFGSSAAAAANAPIIPWGIPADFDVAGFVRNGKTYFIRLQAAWDKGDINDIREFTTPEMFGELRLQLQERGNAANNTDVVQIDGELLGIETLEHDYLATIKFTGLIKEAPDASAEPFAEIWNLSKPVNGTGGWVLAGIQQV
ncbi:membrane protein [Herbaspirillum hiltneri N3]|uniref:Membrane protein n=1 Tax=Herbaspirillum hiltneri N3 TaxID=1262470 RepID=A0ABM5UWL8_9BURK|nr:Tim44-like domain-containing protein [Herbaspirillum hiltneri]AKZ61588.1 membrane protein [Herbaspirillum hiltneri N3]